MSPSAQTELTNSHTHTHTLLSNVSASCDNCEPLCRFSDRLLERVRKVYIYNGSAGHQRVLFCGKPNNCGHYYYGTHSRAGFKCFTLRFLPLKVKVSIVAICPGRVELFCFLLLSIHSLHVETVDSQECFNCIRVGAKAFWFFISQWAVVVVTSQ